MSNELKRVGLVFTQEGAVDFKKTLQEVNLELNKNYNQFKLTQAQWDSSTKSTEKLRAEQEYLKNAYEIQADKVSTLKMQLSDLENAENKNTTAIKKKRNELTNAEVKLETYNKRLKEIENQLTNTGKKIEEFGTKVENIGNKIEGAGKKVSAFSIATGTALVASAKSAIDFEDAFTGVEKTVDGTEQQMAELKQGIRDMAKEIPSTTTEISAVAEAAGQLGIKTEDILSFTRVMIDLGNSTNLSAEEAASSLAKFANVTKMSANDYDKLGATIVALGNNFATTEADIVEMATRLAATGELAGLSQSQILSLATAMSSVGIEAEAGGSAMSKLLKQIQVAVETGSSDLKDFAKVAGMTTSEFKQAFEKDAVSALTAFISGLNDTKRNGKSAVAILEDMDLKEVRLSNTILSLANASDVMTKAVKVGGEAWEDNTALTNEANKRYDTLKSKITIAINKIKDLAITFGNKLTPTLSKTIDKIEDLTKWVSNLTDEQVEWILKIAGVVTALGPLLTILGKVTGTVGGVIKTIGTFTQAIGVMKGTVTTTSTAVNGLASIITGLTGPVGIATIAIGALTAGVLYFTTKQTEAQKEAKSFAEEIANQKQTLEDYNKSIDDTTNANLAQINSIDRLKNELSTLVDENGKVKEGYEGRVSFILNQLNEALGKEYKLNGDIIQNYKDLQAEIDKTIEKKRAEIILSGEEEKNANAVKEEETAVENLRTAREKLLGVQEEYGMNLDELREKAENSHGKEKEYLNNVINAYDDATQAVKQNTEDKKTYENDYALFMEGKYNEVGKKVKEATSDWTSTSLGTIRESIVKEADALEDYKKIYEETGSQVAKTQMEQAERSLQSLADELTNRTSTISSMSTGEITAWNTLGSESYRLYSEQISKMSPEMQQKIQQMTGIVASETALPDSVGGLANKSTGYFQKLLDFKKVAADEISGASGIINQDTSVQNEAGNLATRTQTILKSNDSSEWGKDMVDGLGKGIQTQSNSKSFTDKLWGLASKIKSYIHFSRPDVGPLREYERWMPDMVEGLGRSLEKSSPKLINSVKNMAGEMSNELQNINYETLKDSSSSNNIKTIKTEIDYNKMANAIAKALTNCKFTLDEDGFAKIVKDELYKVV